MEFYPYNNVVMSRRLKKPCYSSIDYYIQCLNGLRLLFLTQSSLWQPRRKYPDQMVMAAGIRLRCLRLVLIQSKYYLELLTASICSRRYQVCWSCNNAGLVISFCVVAKVLSRWSPQLSKSPQSPWSWTTLNLRESYSYATSYTPVSCIILH